MAFDFPSAPAVGQEYISAGVTYTWNGYAWVITGAGGGTPGVDYVMKAGDTMTGFLTLNADPQQPLHASTKQYVDFRALPLGGITGQAIVKDPVNAPQWGATIDCGNF